MHIDRRELIQEERLRLLIRKSIKTINRKKTLEEQKERADQQKLRSYIIKLVEAEKNLVAPHPSTGINVLEDLLKKVIPQIEAEYKKLTTSPEQRSSFRTHIINAIQNSLAPTKASEKAGSPEEEEKAIDIDPKVIKQALSMLRVKTKPVVIWHLKLLKGLKHLLLMRMRSYLMTRTENYFMIIS